MATAISLEEATPRKSYRGPDGAVRQTIDVVENLSLRFDRAFYASVLVLQVADAVVDEKANEVMAINKLHQKVVRQRRELESWAVAQK